MKRINIAVRDFSLPVPRRGSIETHSGYGPLPTTGQELHLYFQEMQALAHENYSAEFRLSQTFDVDEFQFVVSGRTDGFFAGEKPILEEIKTAFNVKDLAKKLTDQPNHPYCLQLKTYGYFYYLATGTIPQLRFQLISTRNRQAEILSLDLDVAEYESWLKLRLEELADETRKQRALERKRKKIAGEITFPFPVPREGQTELIAKVEECLRAEEPLMVQAPTGLGKTAGVIYPTLKEALSRGQRLVYVTPKNSQHRVAEDAIERFQEQGAKLKALTINAKSKMCLKSEPMCNPDYCEYAKDHYTKVYDHNLIDKLAKKKNLTPRVFKKIGEEYQVCPFELQWETVDLVDAVICDYNYVFSPRGTLGRLSPVSAHKSKKPNLVIDEAHNLPTRAADYYSPMLSGFALELLREPIRRVDEEFRAEAEDLLDLSLSVLRSCRPEGCTSQAQIKLLPEDFIEHDERLREFLNRYLGSEVEIAPRDPILKLSNSWSEFCEAVHLTGDHFFATYKYNPHGGSVKITCCDASEMLKESYGAFAHVVAFSATLKPFEYYAKLSGFEVSTVKTAEFVSPFPKTQRKLLVIPQVSTKYSDRERNYSKISEAIRRIVSVKPGNYFVFFPSFDFLERVAKISELTGFKVITQKRDMKASEVQGVLEELHHTYPPKIVFAVQGGVFSEGVDYPGDMLIGALIVGPGLPNFDLERELIRNYFDKSYGSGFDYAYTFPAMTKVIQSAGRVIRSSEDRGVIVLMDQRFIHDNYTKAMPSDWFGETIQELVSENIIHDLREFWTHAKEPAT